VVPPELAPTDWHTLDDIRAALQAGQLSGGCWLEPSIYHPELGDSGSVDRFIDYVSGYGVRVQRSRDLAPTAIYVRRPA